MESKDKVNNNGNEYDDLKSSDFQDLTPKDDVDLTGYKEALDRAFDIKNNKIKNIAITGSYGSGKSSILNTYKKNSKLKFIHISFLHFKECDKNDINTNANKEKNKEDKDTTKIEFSLDCGKETKNEIDKDKIREAVLERKIINHIINQIPFKYISDTNFNVRGNIGIGQAVTKAIFNLLSLGSFFYIILSLTNIIIPNSISSNLEINPIFLMIVSFIFLIAYLTMFFYKLNNRKVSGSIKFKNLELNMDKSKDNCSKYDSFFDSYLDEILYIFENCKRDVIVFEDIDRLEMRIIFERLREINVLLNERLKKKNKVIKFCYLIRDDIFNSEDRVKIFDFIIPVIPIMNSFNAYHTFKNYFKDYIDELNSELVFEICKHINDIRILKNVYNEFLIYIKKLCIKDIFLNYDRILSIIIYKNLFPRDFNGINHNTGFLFNMFRYSYVREQMLIEVEKNLEINVDKFTKEIDIITNNFKNIYFEDINYSDIEIYVINSIYLDTKYAKYSKNIKNKDLYDYIKIKYNQHKKCSNEIIECLDEMFKTNSSDLENIKKMKLNIFQNEYDMDNIKHIQYNNISNDLLYRIFEKCLNFSEDKILSKYHTFLWYLFKNRFIDELSLDFITHSFENTIDNKFILNLFIGKENLGFDYKLDDPVYIIMKYGYTIFLNNTRIYNFYLLDTLLSFLNEYYGEHQNYRNKLKAFFIQLKDNFDFVILYFNKNIIKNMDYNIKLMELLDDFKIKFKHIECHEFDLRLLEFIEKFNLYDITYAHLNLILKNMYGYDEKEIFHKNYSLIYKNKNNQIYKYINENIFEYFYMIVNIDIDYINDDEEAIVDLINSLFNIIPVYQEYFNQVILELSEKYFKKLKQKINLSNKIIVYLEGFENQRVNLDAYGDIFDIKRYIYKQMFRYNIIKFYIENIYDYDNKICEIDDTIVDFINKNDEELKFYNKCSDYDIRDVRVFLNELKNNERIKEDKRIKIQSCIDELDKF